ncbi:hypothetical protein [Mucilaginibacter flavus]|uniref:hypothetical protein n=1 Tax=Mucilaginibacter flavus TaxID=931504 RepID=UPI0025B29462|nr:hypothetical protein [Mucilaginibacter flavus]MDN3581058.1 hypothetical protein [Mucilaginibacter flavus]
MEEEDRLDVEFWLNKTPSERLAEVVRLRRIYFMGRDGYFPDKIEKVAHKRKL